MSTAPQLGKNQMPAGEVLRLSELVSYQEGTVVSRTLRQASDRHGDCVRLRRRPGLDGAHRRV